MTRNLASTLIAGAALSLFALQATAADTDPDTLSDAYAEGAGEAYQYAMIESLTAYQQLHTEELNAAVVEAIETAGERGAQGLEPLLVSGLDELGSRGWEGYALAQERLGDLNEVYWIDAELVRPNAISPVARAGNPIIHHLHTELISNVLAGQLSTGILDPNVSLADGLCSEGGIADFEARFGSPMADELRNLCNGVSGGGGGGMMGSMMDGLSSFDCLTTHLPTRAEQFQSVMGDCMESMVAAGSGSPVASGGPQGSPWEWVFPLRRTNSTQDVTDPTTGEVYSRTEYDANNEPIVDHHYNSDGSVTEHYYNDVGEQVLEVSTDGEGNMTSGRAYEQGKLVESVDNHEDGSYTVKRYDDDGNTTHEQKYDENGTPIDANGNTTSDGLGGDWGQTDECREMNLMLMEGRISLERAADGTRPETVNPDPFADPIPGEEEEDCLGLSGGLHSSQSLGCMDSLVHCNMGQVLDADCNCTTQDLGLSFEHNCSLQILCQEGQDPTEVDGQCTCGGEEPVFEDPSAGGGPRPPTDDSPTWPGGY